MARLEDVGATDGWRCWICDEAVDPTMSVNDARGPSIDSLTTARKSAAQKSPAQAERLAHRGCNTRKGAVAAIIPWAADLFVVDPAPIMTSVERLRRKSGREVMARCPTRDDAQQAADWLAGRVARLAPGLGATTAVEPGGGQFLLILRASPDLL